MFENLSERLGSTLKKLKGQGRITEKNIQQALKDVRMSLLEADVNLHVVKSFMNAVRRRAIGAEVMDSLTPGQQFIKVFMEELTVLLGGTAEGINLSGRPPVAVLLVGLQGSGKTTTAAKMALYLKKKKRLPYLVPVDTVRPAAIEQLTQLGQQIDVPVFPSPLGKKAVDLCSDAYRSARDLGLDTMLVDTAGRLHIDEAMMGELRAIKERIRPVEVLLVVDAMTGQDAVNVAQAFHEAVGLTGVILSKMDGDARGGAALSIKSVTGAPIKMIGTGEKVDGLEPFHPDRMASRILGMGDVLTLIERAHESIDQKKAAEMAKKLRKNRFTIEDFQQQLQEMKNLGSMEDVLKMVPGMGAQMKKLKGMRPPDEEIKKIEAIANSMTHQERRDHSVLNGSRRRRIARGSGTTVQDVNRFIKQYLQARELMRRAAKGVSMRDIMRNILPG